MDAIVVAFMAGLAVLCLIMGISNQLLADSGLSQQLGRLDQASQFGVEDNAGGVSTRLVEVIDGWSYTESLAAQIARAGVKLKVTEMLAIKLLATVLLGGAALLLSGTVLLGLPVAVLGFWAPGLWLRIKERRRLMQFGMQLPDMLALLTAGVRAGFSLQQALIAVAKQSPDPMGAEINRMIQEIRLGTPLMEALENMAKRIDSDDLALLVSVFGIQSRVGGNLADILETVSGTMRERIRLKREVQVITSMQRMSGYVLGFLPLGIAAVLYLINPSYIQGMFQGIWLVIPIIAATLAIAGFIVIQKLADIKV